LLTVRQTAVVPLSPRPLLSIPQKVRTGNVVMDTNLRAAHTRKKLLCPIGASVVHRMGFFVEVGELAEKAITLTSASAGAMLLSL
jgi:hypothetical protein